MNYDNEMKRLEGHVPMKEIPESFESDRPMAPVAGNCRRKSAAAAGAYASRSGFNAGSILAAIGAVVLAGVVFFLSDAHFFGKDGKDTAMNSVRTTQGAVNRDALANRSIVEVTEITTTRVAPNAKAVSASTTARPIAKAVTVSKVARQNGAAAASSNGAAAATGSNVATTTDGNAASTDGAAMTLAQAGAPDVVCLFPVNGAAIQENPQLNNLAKEAIAEDADVVVTGYADQTGQPAYNQQLSDRRAKAIGNYLVAHGVPRSHIVIQAKGQTDAFASNALDRRVEVRVV